MKITQISYFKKSHKLLVVSNICAPHSLGVASTILYSRNLNFYDIISHKNHQWASGNSLYLANPIHPSTFSLMNQSKFQPKPSSFSFFFSLPFLLPLYLSPLRLRQTQTPPSFPSYGSSSTYSPKAPPFFSPHYNKEWTRVCSIFYCHLNLTILRLLSSRSFWASPTLSFWFPISNPTEQ